MKKSSEQHDPLSWPNKPRVVLLGAQGRMAQIFKRIFADHGCQVTGIDRGDHIADSVLVDADILWICVPMEYVVDLIKLHGPKLRPEALIGDINSLKMAVVDSYKNLSCDWLSLHPMFGPFVSSLEDQKIIFCRKQISAASDWLLNLLVKEKCTLHASDAETHDRMMSFIQVLIHFNKMVVAKTLLEKDRDFAETLAFTSPIYRLELAVIARMFAQSSGLYAHIQLENKFAEEIRATFVKHAQQLGDALKSGQAEAVHKLFADAHEYFHEFSEEGLQI